MRKELLSGGISLVAVAVFIAGCTDMTQQQYHDQQVQQQIAQDNAVAGTYEGSMTSLDDQSSLGGIVITIDSGAQPISSSDGTTTVSQAILTGSVKLVGATTSEAPFTASYSASTGALVGTITIPDEGLTLKLNGNITGSSLTGTVVSDQYPGDGGRFQTTLNGSLPTEQGSSSGQVPSHLMKYDGTGTDSDCTINGNTCDVSLTIDDTPSTSADAFADQVVRVSNVVVNVIINIGQGDSGKPLELMYSFGGTNGTAQLDKRNGTLMGKAPTGSNSTVSMNCVSLGGSLSAGNMGWSCDVGEVNFRVTPSAAVHP